ncbi:MAG: hypothetical protein WBX19_12365 [Terracidiphilus sp.]
MSRKTKSRPKREQRPEPFRRFVGPLVILAAAAIAVWPLIASGPSCGPDFSFHIVSWIEAQRTLREGIVYPHWASGPNFGAGEPRFVFYPPLTWMAGSFLGLIFPWRLVSIVLVYLLLAATGFANRALARQMLADGPATLAGCASIFFGNMLVDVYMRSDYAELTAGFWIPLLLLLQLRKSKPSASLLERTLFGAVPSALVFAGIWLSNGPLVIMASYMLAATALVSAAIEKSWAPAARAALSAVVGSALAAVYLVPAICERGWASIGLAISEPEYIVENNWLFSHLADPGWSRFYVMLQIHSWLAVVMFAISAASVWLAWKRGKLARERAWWIPLALIPVAVLLMQLPLSEPLWKWLPALRYLQFPWRWLGVTNAPLALFFAAAVWVNPLRGRVLLVAVCALLFIMITGSTSGICFQNCHNVIAAIPLAEPIEGIRGKPEYAPPGIRHPLVEADVLGNCVVSSLEDLSGQPQHDSKPTLSGSAPPCTSNFVQMVNQSEHKIFMGNANRSGYLILHLRSYPAWRVTVNGRAADAAREGGYGLIAVPIAKGPALVVVDWTTTPDVWTGRGISVLTLVLLIALFVVERKGLRHPEVDGDSRKIKDSALITASRK